MDGEGLVNSIEQEEIIIYVKFYLAVMSFIYLVTTFTSLRDEQYGLALIAAVSFLLFLLALIGYLKEIKSLLWIGIIILSIYTLYLIGAVIWSFTPTDATLFIVTVVITLSIINILVIIKMKDQINLL